MKTSLNDVLKNSSLDGGELASLSGHFISRTEYRWYPLYGRVGWPQTRAGHFGEEKILLSVPLMGT